VIGYEPSIHDVSTKIFDRLRDETWFYPGHGGDSTLGHERPSLPEWQACAGELTGTPGTADGPVIEVARRLLPTSGGR
jgi:hypothetical protein